MALFFVELLVRGMALCLLLALTLLALRRAAATYRHLLCTLALGGLLTLPLVQGVLPPLPVLKPSKPAVIAASAASVVLAEPLPPAPQHSEPLPQPLPSEPGRGEDLPRSSLSWGGAGWVVACWALGAALLLLRLAVALVRLRQLAKRSQRTSLLETEILVSEHVTTPLTWSVRRPVILLPAALLTGEPAVAESALRHEKAHIARRDWLWHLLAEVVCALCWFQPGAWWLRRRLRAESERACDDRVLLSGVSGPDYAAHLLEILKVGRANALAPGMAAVGSMEARVKHILDPKKPRRSQRLRLALTAVLGLVLLPLASLKVAAKPGERPVSRLQEAVELLDPKLPLLTPSALLVQAKATLVAPKPFAGYPLGAEGGEPKRAGRLNGTLAMPQPIATAPAESPTLDSTIPLEKVVWGRAVDGLEPGFLLTSSPRVPMNSKLTYQTLVRNTSNKPLSFLTRLLQYDGYEAPTVDGKPTKGAKRGYPVDPLYNVTLAPGESVIVPAQNGRESLEIFVGEGGSGDSPSLAELTPGHLKIVQPVTIYRSLEKPRLASLMGRYTLSRVSPKGKVRTESANRATGLGEGTGRIEGGQTLEAYSYLEIGTRNAEAERSAASAVWGKVDRGLQCGIRMLSDQRVFKTGDTLEAELLWRNVSNKKAHWVNPMQLDIVPIVRKATGSECMVDMGARFMFLPSTTDYAPGEVRSLGILRVTLVAEGTPSPNSNRVPGHITLAPGTYLFSGSGGVARPGDPCPDSGEVAFTVVGDMPQATKTVKDEGIVWGKEAEGYRYGLRNPGTGEVLEVWVQNVTKETQKLTYAAYPPEVTGSLSLRDNKNKPVSAPMDSIDTGTVFMTKVLRSGEKALILAPSLKNALPLLKPGETYTAQWDNKTGKLTFRVPQREGTAWSQETNGVQLGLRLPKGVTTFSKLSEACFEVVLRNLGKPTNVSWITPVRFGFYGPELFTKDGEPIPYVHTLGGPYRSESRELGSGETIVLGTIRLPRGVQEHWDSLPQGPYLASGSPPPSPYEARFSLGVTVSGKSEQNLEAKLPFTVTRPR